MRNVIYIMSCTINDTIYYKVGVCKGDPNKRLKTLQTGNPFELKLEWWEEREKANKAENYVHHQLSKYRVRKNGEWFTGLDLKKIRITLLLYLDQV